MTSDGGGGCSYLIAIRSTGRDTCTPDMKMTTAPVKGRAMQCFLDDLANFHLPYMSWCVASFAPKTWLKGSFDVQARRDTRCTALQEYVIYDSKPPDNESQPPSSKTVQEKPFVVSRPFPHQYAESCGVMEPRPRGLPISGVPPATGRNTSV